MWGLWREESFWFSVGNATRTARNLRENPSAALHLEDATAIVIVEGTAEPSSADIDTLIDAWLAKYRSAGGNRDAMTGFDRAVYVLRPHTAFGWTLDGFPGVAIRWGGDHEHVHPA